MAISGESVEQRRPGRGSGSHPRSDERQSSSGLLSIDNKRPTHLGRYVVLQEVGRGGMGVVWTAYDPKLDRKVAIKLLSGSSRASTRQARFIREAQALAKLNHPNIVTIHDVDTHDGQLYMAMELVDGQTLRRWLKKRRGWREIVRVFIEAGQGLAAAHAADITHRDFKPSNVLISRDGRVKVLDFGLAKHADRDPLASLDDDDEHSGPHPLASSPASGLSSGLSSGPSTSLSSGSAVVRTKLRERSLHSNDDIMEVIGSSAGVKLTKVGRIVGTPAYMAPEQYPSLGRHELGPWTDQFSFGVALYEALYGDLPFAGKDLLETHTNIQKGRIREPRREESVPGWVFRLLQRALREEPAERFPSMDALLEALRADPARRRRRIALVVGGLGLLAFSGFSLTRSLGTEEPEPCQGAGEHLEDVWDDEHRAAVERALVATELPFAADTARRVSTSLDRYSQAWIEQHTVICEATRVHGEQSETLLDVRMTCLDRRLSELGALVRVLQTPEKETVSRAVTAVAELRRPEPCASAQPGVESALPDDPARRDRFLAVQAQLDDAHALAAAGRHDSAREQAASASQEAARHGFRRLLARARIIEGIAYKQLHQPEQAEHVLREGIMMAAEVEDVRTEVQGWATLLSVAGVLLEKPEEAASWQFAAEAALARASAPKDLESLLKLSIGAVLLKQDRFEEATRVGEDALRIALEVGGHGSIQHAQALNNLGIVAGKQADWVLAERRLRESYQLKKQLFGPDHPEVAANGMNLANVLGQHAKKVDGEVSERAYDEAERLYEQVVAFRERTYGSTSPIVGRTLANLGLLQHNRGDLGKARHTYERAVSLLRGLSGSEGDLTRALNNLAQLEVLEQNYERAEAYHRESLAIQLAKYGPAHLSVGATRLHLCQVLESAERYGTAIKECERALEVFEASFDDRPNPSLVSVHGLLSQLHQAAGHPGRAETHTARAAQLQRRLDASTADGPPEPSGDASTDEPAASPDPPRPTDAP